jgi:hypothetical protein
VFHANDCCWTDCLVRYCTCDVKPVVVEVDGDVEDAVAQAESLEGSTLPDGATVDALIHCDESEHDDGVIAQFMTSSGGGEDESDTE